MGIETEAVLEIFKSETRVNVSAGSVSPGLALGASVLPKDLRAVGQCARNLDLRLPLIESILPSNNDHIERAVDEVLHTRKRKIGVLGLSFKTGTDDLRESPLVQFIKRLLGEGCQVRIWDRDVALGRLVGSNRQFIKEVIPHIDTLPVATFPESAQSTQVGLIATPTLAKP